MSDTVLQNKAEITLDPSDFEANSRKVLAALQQIQNAARAANGPLSSVGQSGAAASAAFGNLARQAQISRGAINSLNSALNGNAGATNSLRNATSQAAAATNRNTAALRQNTAANRASTTATRANTTALNSSNAAITGLSTHVQQLNAAIAGLTTRMGNLNQAQQGAANGLGFMGRALAALSFGLVAKEAVQLTDAYTSLSMRLKVATNGIASSAGAMGDVSRIARTVRAELDAVGMLYSKVAFSGAKLGATQTQVARVTETVGKGLKLFGASAQETSSTIIQLGQALASGKLQGEEFRAMAENAPALMEILAQSMGKTRGELKKLGSEGKITSEVIIQAFGNSSSAAIKKLDSDFAQLPVTVSESVTLLKNSLEEALGSNDSMVAGTKTLASAIQLLANNIETVIPVVGALSLALGVGFVTSSLRASAAAGTLRTSIAAAFGGGLGIAITGLIIGIGALANHTLDAHRQVSLLAAQTDEAGDASHKTGVEALVAARGVASFGGQAGEAAGKLWDMATAARAAAVETAKLNLMKAQADYQTVHGQTSEGLNERWYRNQNQKAGTFGDVMRRGGERVQIAFDWIMKPGDDQTKKAEAVALKNLHRAEDAVDALSDRSMESFIPKIERTPGDGPKKKRASKKSDPVGDIWKRLENSVKLAPLVGVELESMTTQLELQDAANRKLKPEEIDRINRLQAQARAGKLLADMLDQTNDLRRENNISEQQLWDKASGASEDQLSLDRALYEYRARALKEQINIENEAYRNRENEYRKELERANELKSIQRGLDYATSVSPDMANRAKQSELNQRRTDLDAAFNSPNSTMTDRDYKLGKRGIEYDERALANQFYASMGESISGVAELFGNKMGAKVDKLGKLLDAVVKAASGDVSGFGPLGKALSLFTTNRDGTQNELGAGISDAMQNTLSGIGRALGIGNRKTDAVAAAGDATAANTDEIVVLGRKLPSQLASTLASAMVGAGIGGAVGGGPLGTIGGALGGAALEQFAGKALGAFAGPLGGIIGGLAGSLLGGLFGGGKKSYGTAVLTGSGNITSEGRGGSGAKDAFGAAGSVQDGLAKIAEELGGKANGQYSVAIGQYDGKWRVRDDAFSGKLNYKGTSAQGLHNFDDDQAAAVAYAIENAIKDGAITGLSDLAKKALGKMGSEGAIALVQSFNSIRDDLAEMMDPIGFSVKSLNDEMNSLRARMTEVSASAADLATVEEYRVKRLAEILKEQLAPVTEFQKSLNGTDSGVTLANQLKAAEATYNTFRSDILSGKTVDQDAFSQAGQELNSLAAQLYGSATTQYQDYRADMIRTSELLAKTIAEKVNGGVSNVDPIIASGTATVDAIKVGTTQTVDAIERLILEVRAQGARTGTGGRAVNGSVQTY